MKKIEAIVKMAALERVIDALVRTGITGITLNHVRGSGRQRGHSELYRGPDYVVNLLPKIKLEILVADDRVDEMIGVVREAALTGRIGDGKKSWLCLLKKQYAFAREKAGNVRCNPVTANGVHETAEGEYLGKGTSRRRA